MSNEELIQIASNTRKNAYAPYSSFSVGSALLSSNGNVFTGCNIENASFGATICAERAAISNAVSSGVTDFTKIAIVGAKDFCYPCGICRQVLSEFCDSDTFEIILCNSENKTKVFKLGDLLPNFFNL